MGEFESAVLVKNAGMTYRSSFRHQQQVFHDVNLTVPVGTVYGLLGPSGCGKTTLLKCILGRLDLKQGSVSVFGHRPAPGSNVGYMPQDTCMHLTFTIGECWTYYGTILGMSKNQINDAIDYFIALLNLPPATTVNGQLSGGELRRVAFATALIHQPKLLVLDEPTVGIDCITKRRMWDHLLKLANERRTTIILTTHYIEEARATHMVGLMHRGTLVVEDCTSNLLQKFGCDSLENVFLEICRDSSSLACIRSVDNDNSVDVLFSKDQKRTRVKGHNNFVQDDGHSTSCMGSTVYVKSFGIRAYVLRALIWKNLLHLYRYRGFMFFVMLLPCIQFTATVMAGTEDFGQSRVALFNEDLGTSGARYAQMLEGDTVHLESYNSSRSAFAALRAGHVQGLVTIQQNFSEAHLQRIVRSPLLNSAELTDGKISIVLDNIDQRSIFIRFRLLETYERFLRSAFNDSGLNPSNAQPVFLFGPEDLEFLSHPNTMQMDATAVAVVSYFAPAAVAVFTLFVEVTCGYLERSVVAGVTSTEIVLGLLVMLLGVACVQMATILVAAYILVFGHLTWSTSGPLFLVSYFTGISGMSAGIFLSLCFRDVQLLLIIAGYVLLLTVAVSGGFWPLAAAPTVMRYIFSALPLAYPVKAISAISMGANFYLSEVIRSLAISLTHAFIYLTLSVVLLRIKS